MGLPLFIAPVEPDIKSKSDNKSTNLPGSSRARVRAARALGARERRALQRRAAILRENFPTPGPEQPSTSSRPTPHVWGNDGNSYPPPPPMPPLPPPPPQSAARYPWIESGQLPPPEAYDAPSAISQSTTRRHSGPSAAGRLSTLRINHDRLMNLLGDGYPWATSASPPPPGDESSRPAGSEALADSIDPDVFRRDRIAPEIAARFDRSPDRSLRRRVGQTAEAAAAQSRSRSRRTRFHSTGARRSSAMDGLGDRNRSLSPEWDTLLTTLTPDPQPPSVGSSFVSASASASAAPSQSQSAAASSRTSLTGPDMVDGPTGPTDEQPCENSDSEYEPTDDEISVRPDHPSTNVPSRHRRFVAALDSNENRSTSYVRADDPSERPSLSGHYGPEYVRDQRNIIQNRMNAIRERALQAGFGSPLRNDPDAAADSRGATSDTVTRESSADLRDGDGDGDGGNERAPDRRGGPDATNRSVDDVAWVGMHRIVRNLAEREDIPEEWWAAAGLSRTISDDP